MVILQVVALAKPSNETISAVNAFFASHNFSTKAISSAGDWISFSIPVSKANEMLGSTFSVFTEGSSGRQVVRTLSYSIPDNLKGHLDFVHPTTT